MGVCCSSDNNHKKRIQYKKTSKESAPEEIPVHESSVIVQDGQLKNQRPINNYLQSGNIKMIEEMIQRKELIPNEYIINGADKTLLHEAGNLTVNPQIINCLLQNGWDVDAVEKETGNTVLMMTAIDLKLELVKTILQYNPNLAIKNRKGQDVFAYINDNLILKKGNKKSDLTPNEKETYNKILALLTEQAKNKHVEVLDDSDNKKKDVNHRESDDFKKSYL